MKRAGEESDEEESAERKQQKSTQEVVDWEVALRSPAIRAELAHDMARVLKQYDDPEDEEWVEPSANTLAFLKDMEQTLRFRR
jgi:hypothetical protein